MMGRILNIVFTVLIVFTFITILCLDNSYASYTNATGAGTRITNIATVTGANLSAAVSSTISTQVQPIAGGSWGGSVDITGANSGSLYTNHTFLTNLGNQAFTFNIFVVSNGATSGSDLAWTIYTNNVYGTPAATGIGDSSGAAFSIPRPQAGTVDIEFVVFVSNTITQGTQWWTLKAKVSEAHENEESYQGDAPLNSIWYGGSSTSGWGQLVETNSVIAYHPVAGNDGATYMWSVTISGPNIAITKSIKGISDVASLGYSIAIPGATITNMIFITNSGSGDATGMIVKDYWAQAYVTNGAAFIINNNSGGDAWVASTNQSAQFVQWSNSTGTGLLQPAESMRFGFNLIIK